MAQVSFSHVDKFFGKTQVLHDINCEIPDGQFTVVVGPSGCGKSTLLRCLAGLEEVTSGEVRINHAVVNHLEPKDRDIAMVFQNYALYPHMKVFDNMAYGLRLRGLPPDQIKARVEAAAQKLDLAELLYRKPSQLSGGQRQRVAMGRAIVREPQVFLFDEPLSNLDAKLRVQMRLEIKKLQRQLGVTSVFVTHDQVEAMTLGDVLIVMRAGYIEQTGPPLELYSRPQTAFVASFIGSPAMNFWPGRLSADGSKVDLGPGFTLTLPQARPELANQEATVGVRPEHLRPSPQTSPAPGRLLVLIEVVEELGAETLAYGRFHQHQVALRLPGETPVTAGGQLAFSAPPEHLHLFDPQTNRRL